MELRQYSIEKERAMLLHIQQIIMLQGSVVEGS